MVRGSAFHPLCRLLEDVGVDSARMLHRFGLSPAFAGTEAPREDAAPSAPFADFIREAHRISGLEAFGLQAGSNTSVHSIGDLGKVLGQSFTVHALIRKFAELMPLINSGSETWLEPGSEPGAIRFSHRQPIDTAHAQIDGYAIPIFIDGVRLGAGPQWRPKWITLHRTAGHPADWEALSDAQSEQDADYFSFEVPECILRMKLPCTSKGSASDKSAEARLLAHSPPTELPDSLAQVIRAGFGARVPSVDAAAEWAGMSRRTLRRRLRDEYATSYREIVERTRIREAFSLLERKDLLIKEISRHLDYANPANFTNAFRGWTGRAPSEYRATQSGEFSSR